MLFSDWRCYFVVRSHFPASRRPRFLSVFAGEWLLFSRGWILSIVSTVKSNLISTDKVEIGRCQMAQGGGNSNFFQWIYLFYSVNHLLQPTITNLFIGYFKFIYSQFIDKMYHRVSLLFNLFAFHEKTKK